MTRPRPMAGVTCHDDPSDTPEWAPALNAVTNTLAFINGNILSGGILLRDKAEAVLLAEELLDWAYGPAPREQAKKIRKRKP